MGEDRFARLRNRRSHFFPVLGADCSAPIFRQRAVCSARLPRASPRSTLQNVLRVSATALILRRHAHSLKRESCERGCNVWCTIRCDCFCDYHDGFSSSATCASKQKSICVSKMQTPVLQLAVVA